MMTTPTKLSLVISTALLIVTTIAPAGTTITDTDGDDTITTNCEVSIANLTAGGNDVLNHVPAAFVDDADIIFDNNFDVCAGSLEVTIDGAPTDQNTVMTGSGPETVTILNSTVRIFTNAGDDMVDAQQASSVTVVAESGNDIVLDSAGNDLIATRAGNDMIILTLGDDIVSGGFGADTIISSDTGMTPDGDDTINAGGSFGTDDGEPDVFRYEGINIGFDFLANFVRGDDQLDFSAILPQLGITTEAEFQAWLDANVINDGFNATIQLDGTMDNAILVIGQTAIDISDFITGLSGN